MPVDLSSAGISKTAALTAAAAVAERWSVPKKQWFLLIGVPESTANHWFADLARGEIDERESLKPGVLERISHLVSIYDLLHRLVKGAQADEWMSHPNRAFGGHEPRELLLTGRFDDLLKVRNYLERAVSH